MDSYFEYFWDKTGDLLAVQFITYTREGIQYTYNDTFALHLLKLLSI